MIPDDISNLQATAKVEVKKFDGDPPQDGEDKEPVEVLNFTISHDGVVSDRMINGVAVDSFEQTDEAKIQEQVGK